MDLDVSFQIIIIPWHEAFLHGSFSLVSFFRQIDQRGKIKNGLQDCKAVRQECRVKSEHCTLIIKMPIRLLRIVSSVPQAESLKHERRKQSKNPHKSLHGSISLSGAPFTLKTAGTTPKLCEITRQPVSSGPVVRLKEYLN
jgi:hypothetical protein